MLRALHCRECIRGDDPLTTLQFDEVQTISCQCTAPCSGSVSLAFRGDATVPLLLATSTAAAVQTALQVAFLLSNSVLGIVEQRPSCSHVTF